MIDDMTAEEDAFNEWLKTGMEQGWCGPTGMDFEEWLKVGMDEGWCGPPVCFVHDGFPESDEEYTIEEIDGEPPCMHMIRLYEDKDHQTAVELAHGPSNWRKNR